MYKVEYEQTDIRDSNVFRLTHAGTLQIDIYPNVEKGLSAILHLSDTKGNFVTAYMDSVFLTQLRDKLNDAILHQQQYDRFPQPLELKG